MYPRHGFHSSHHQPRWQGLARLSIGKLTRILFHPFIENFVLMPDTLLEKSSKQKNALALFLFLDVNEYLQLCKLVHSAAARSYRFVQVNNRPAAIATCAVQHSIHEQLLLGRESESERSSCRGQII